MNPAIEYLLRGDRTNLLSFPCSLLLEKEGHRLVVTLSHNYGKDDIIMIKHYDLGEDNTERKLPPCTIHEIEPTEIASKLVVIPGYTTLFYEEDTYITGGRQHSDPPYATTQEAEYNTAINELYNNKINQDKRTNWLWESFERVHVPQNLKWDYGKSINDKRKLQRDIVAFYDKKLWKKWLFWQRHLNFQVPIATELLFRNYFFPKMAPRKVEVPDPEPVVSSKTLFTHEDYLYIRPLIWGR